MAKPKKIRKEIIEQVAAYEFPQLHFAEIQQLMDRLEFRLRDLLLQDGKVMDVKIYVFEKKVEQDKPDKK